MTRGLLAVVVAVLVLLGAGGAALAQPLRPEDFPNHTADGFVTLHWRLDTEGDRVRVSGIVDPGGRPFTGVTLAFYGLDERGRVASQTSTQVGPAGFSPGPAPFAMTLRSSGRERTYLVGVERFEQPGLRSGR